MIQILTHAQTQTTPNPRGFLQPHWLGAPLPQPELDEPSTRARDPACLIAKHRPVKAGSHTVCPNLPPRSEVEHSSCQHSENFRDLNLHLPRLQPEQSLLEVHRIRRPRRRDRQHFVYRLFRPFNFVSNKYTLFIQVLHLFAGLRTVGGNPPPTS